MLAEDVATTSKLAMPSSLLMGAWAEEIAADLKGVGMSTN
jgi:hypothetical protein